MSRPSAILPTSDIPDRPSCHLPKLAFAVTDRAPQDAVVEMIGGSARIDNSHSGDRRDDLEHLSAAWAFDQLATDLKANALPFIRG